MGKITEGIFRANVALPQGTNPLPAFRDPNHDALVRVKPGVSDEYQSLMGLDCGKRYLPYQLQDRYDRNRKEQDIPAIIMENAYLKATFLPTLGGRLISLFGKETNRELLYCNTSLQVCNLSNLDAWFAGGIEWNIGQYGHAFTTCSDVFASLQKDEEGEEFLRLYEFERCKGLWWHIDFHLPDESKLLFAHVAIHNLTDERTSLYYWTNTAVALTGSTRVLASSKEALYLDPYAPEGTRLFGHMQLPHMEIYKDIDPTYPNQFSASNEYFFLCEKSSLPWECAVESDGSGFFEASTHPLSFRKMFCWGSHAGGKRWQRYLAPDSEDEYIEIQSGLAASQLHGTFLGAHSSLCWTQAFGALSVSPEKVHSAQYEVAMHAAEQSILTSIDRESMERMHRHGIHSCQIAPGTILHRGSGWGYLEQHFLDCPLPEAFLFVKESITKEELPYLRFIKEGSFSVMNPSERPLAPPPISPQWKIAFLKALKHPRPEKEKATLLHCLGILHLESDEVACAQSCWLEAMNLLPNAWTARNLAQLEQRRGEVDAALTWYEKARMLPGYYADPAIAEEYCSLLITERRENQANECFKKLPDTWLETSETLRILRARLAVLQRDAELIKHLVFDRELGHIREGDTPLNTLWREYHLIRYTTEHPEKSMEEAVRQVEQNRPIPWQFNFMMFRA